jgi:hypothetical protein
LPCTKWRIRFGRNIQNLFVAQDEEIGYVALSWRCCRMVLHCYPHIQDNLNKEILIKGKAVNL